MELLENAYPNFAGLNLTFEVREGFAESTRPSMIRQAGREKYRCPSLEAQIANLADEITYYSHDLDDAVDFEILNAPQLEENAVWQRSHRAVLRRYPEVARARTSQTYHSRHYRRGGPAGCRHHKRAIDC